MKRSSLSLTLLATATLAFSLTACSGPGLAAPASAAAESSTASETPAAADAAQSNAAATAAEAQEQKNIAAFDDLDFNVFSNAKWDELSHSHAKDVIVHWPDGHVTEGIDVHIADLQKLFVYAPDTRIKQHPHKLAQGNQTAVTGVMEGTFTKPMPGPDGQMIQPTGKAFALPMATVGRWENGVMQEEWLYWDNQAYMNQIGLGK